MTSTATERRAAEAAYFPGVPTQSTEFSLTDVFGPPTDADLVHDLREVNLLYDSSPATDHNALVAELREILATGRRSTGQAITIMLYRHIAPRTPHNGLPLAAAA